MTVRGRVCGVCGDEENRSFEVRGAHSSKTATSGAASFVEVAARAGQVPPTGKYLLNEISAEATASALIDY
jgi:hypothetical protein